MTDASDETVTIAAAGDAMVTKRLTRNADEGRRELRRILTDADASIVNLEGPLHDFESAPVAGPLAHFRSPAWAPTNSPRWASTSLRRRTTTSAITASRG